MRFAALSLAVAALLALGASPALACGAPPAGVAASNVVMAFVAASGAAMTGPRSGFSSWSAGQVAYDSANNRLIVCDGTAWRNILASAGAAATAAGSSGQVQFNDGGSLGADAALFWDNSIKWLRVGAGTDRVVHVNNDGGIELTRTDSGLGPYIDFKNNIADDYDIRIQQTSNTNLSILNSNVGIGTASPAASAALDVTSTTRGFLPPRMTGTQRDAISSPATGLMVFNTTSGAHEYWSGSAWVPIGGGVPNGTIAAFASTSCPSGWAEYTPARGRFLRGIDNGAGNDPAGTRIPGNVQSDAIIQHQHNMVSQTPGADNIIAFSDTNVDNTYASGGNTGARGDVYIYVGDVKNATVSTETRPRNVAVTFCQFQGGAPLVATPSGAAGAVQFANGTGGLNSNANFLWDNANARLGIGTATPSAPLQVMFGSYSNPATSGSTQTGSSLRLTSQGVTTLDFGSNNSGTAWIQNTSTGNHAQSWPLAINPNGGNVGIGTTAPAARLDVSGVISASGRAYPWRWSTRSNGLNFATTTWTTVPNSSITFTLPANADVMIQFDGSVIAVESNIHCNLRFILNGVGQGHSVYGDVITMGSVASGAWWNSVSRSRWVTLAAGTHTVAVQGRSEPAGSSADRCSIIDEEYARLVVTVMAYPTP